MPLGELAGGLIGAVLRLVVYFFLEVILEIVIRGPGYLICRIFRKDVDPDGGWVATAGFAFWLVLLCGVYFLYKPGRS